ncbi:MAG: hypothetical protein AAF945_19875 [Actinomycetota bacterium]
MGGQNTPHERGRSVHRRWRRAAAAVAATLVGIGGIGLSAGSIEAQSDETDRISLVHAIPGVEVDLSLDGDDFASDFQLGEVRDISEFAGRSLAGLAARRVGTEQPLGPISATSVPAEGPASVVVHLDETLSILVTAFDDTAPSPAPAPGNGLLTVRHVAAAPAVDVFLQATAQTVSLAPTAEVNLVVPAGALGPASLLRSGDALLVLPDITIVEGRRSVVYVSGTAGEGSLVTTLDSFAIGTSENGPKAPNGNGDDDPADQDSAGPTVPQSGDGTPQPTLVDTGVLPVPGDATSLLGLGLALLAGAAVLFGLRRRLT